MILLGFKGGHDKENQYGSGGHYLINQFGDTAV